MRRVIGLLFLICLPWAARADGKVYPSRAVPVPVNIPDQRALIHWSNGVERLVVETRFTGEGTNFAWVVPLPARPVIEPVATGLFPTLEYLMGPELVHRPTRWYLGVVGVLGLVYLIRTVKPGQELGLKQWGAWLAVTVCTGATGVPPGVAVGLFLATSMILVKTESGSLCSLLALALTGFVLCAMLLPALSTAGSRGKAGTSRPDVEIIERQQADIFDTVTVAAKDPSALNAWLRENGFAVSTNAESAVAAYVKEGWVFAAAKVHREQTTAAPTAAHPLSFTFASPEPVYPMRLTGVDNGPLSVELYVFGPGLASAPGFRVDRCTEPRFPAPPQHWIRGKPKLLELHSSPLREWVADAAAATRLTAQLTPAQMRNDVRLTWLPFEEEQRTVYSRAGASHIAANWASAALVPSFGLGALFAPWLRKRGLRRPVSGWAILSLALGAGCAVYLWLPKVPVRVQKYGPWRSETQLREVAILFSESTERATLTKGRDEVLKLLQNPQRPGQWDNTIAGGIIHEEDSPGNYSLREAGGVLEFIGYDAAGAPHVLAALPHAPKNP